MGMFWNLNPTLCFWDERFFFSKQIPCLFFNHFENGNTWKNVSSKFEHKASYTLMSWSNIEDDSIGRFHMAFETTKFRNGNLNNFGFRHLIHFYSWNSIRKSGHFSKVMTKGHAPFKLIPNGGNVPNIFKNNLDSRALLEVYANKFFH